MKTQVFLCSMLAMFAIVRINAQDAPVCQPDTAFANSGAIISPTPFQNDTLGDGLPGACINTAYDVTVFVHPPSSIEVFGNSVPVASFKIDSVSNLPDGMSFSCSTEDCLFLADSINCIYLSGIPTADNPVGNYELEIFLTASVGLAFSLRFPDPTFAPGSYVIALDAEGGQACLTSPTTDYNNREQGLSIFPNPVSDIITLHLEDLTGGDGEVSIWDFSGKLVTQRFWSTYDNSLHVGDLGPGLYLLQWSNHDDVRRGRFIIN